MNLHIRILQIVKPFLAKDLDYSLLTVAAAEYKTLLSELCGEDFNHELGKSDIHESNGMALGTLWAVMCIDDVIRTRQFMRGIDCAINDKLVVKEKINILYAGTGPFATLLLPFMIKYLNTNISFTLLEINPYTFKLLKTVISKLDLNKKQVKLVNDDATKIQFESNQPDIIISETMQNSLEKEQQVPVFLNLMRQAKADCVFIPERIEVSIGSYLEQNSNGVFACNFIEKENQIFDLSKMGMREHLKEEGEIDFQIVRTSLKNELKSSDLLLLTEIQVYQDLRINLNESGLTTPRFLYTSSCEKNTNTVWSQCIINEEPHFKIEFDAF